MKSEQDMIGTAGEARMILEVTFSYGLQLKDTLVLANQQQLSVCSLWSPGVILDAVDILIEQK